MAKQHLSTKRALLDKANSSMVIFVSVAAFVVVFSLVATKSLISQAQYQNRVIDAKKEARNQLTDDIEEVKKLQPSYNAFVGTLTNIIGGTSAGNGPQDGDNAKIILDALPSRYDFPALTANLDRLVGLQGASLTSISGTDDEVAQSSNTQSGDPEPVPMPFNLTVTSDYGHIQQTVDAFERSIRPIKLQTISITGDQGNLTMNIGAETYYQPAKIFKVGEKVVK